MTKEITKSIILQEMEDKFKLREFTPAKFLFDETVIPTYDIAQHTEDANTKYAEVSITAGPAAYAFLSVPENQRWRLNAYNVVFMATGAYTVTGVYIQRKLAGASNSIYLDMVAGQTASYAKVLPQPILLNRGDILYVYVDGYTSTAALRLYIDYMREYLR